jgi:hypothetical protein
LEWLRSILAECFPGARLAGFDRIGLEHGLASTALRLRLEGPDAPRSVVIKYWSIDGPGGSDEVPFYATFGRDLGIRIPHCYHGAVDPEHKRGVLVLEDLSGAVQGDVLGQLDLRGAAAVAGTIATLHAKWWESEELNAQAWLQTIGPRAPEWLRSRRGMFMSRFGEQIDATLRDLLERVEAVDQRANQRMAGAPMTLVHGDLHLDNVMFDREPEHPILLDWASAAKGPAVFDLIELLYSMTPLGNLEPTFAVYLGALRQRGVTGVEEGSLRSQLGGALLRRVISSTCGIARWVPDSERERAMIPIALRRITDAVELWRTRDPELFQF